MVESTPIEFNPVSFLPSDWDGRKPVFLRWPLLVARARALARSVLRRTDPVLRSSFGWAVVAADVEPFCLFTNINWRSANFCLQVSEDRSETERAAEDLVV